MTVIATIPGLTFHENLSHENNGLYYAIATYLGEDPTTYRDKILDDHLKIVTVESFIPSESFLSYQDYFNYITDNILITSPNIVEIIQLLKRPILTLNASGTITNLQDLTEYPEADPIFIVCLDNSNDDESNYHYDALTKNDSSLSDREILRQIQLATPCTSPTCTDDHSSSDKTQTTHVCNNHVHDEHGDVLTLIGWPREFITSTSGYILLVGAILDMLIPPIFVSTIMDTRPALNMRAISLIIAATTSIPASWASADCHKRQEDLNNFKESNTAKFQKFIPKSYNDLFKVLMLNKTDFARLFGDFSVHLGEYSGDLITITLSLPSKEAQTVLIPTILLASIFSIVAETFTDFMTLIERRLLKQQPKQSFDVAEWNKSSKFNHALSKFIGYSNIFGAYFKLPTTFMTTALMFGEIIDGFNPQKTAGFMGLSIPAMIIGAAFGGYATASTIYGTIIINNMARHSSGVNDSDHIQKTEQPENTKSTINALNTFITNVFKLPPIDRAAVLGRMLGSSGEFNQLFILAILNTQTLTNQAKAGICLLLLAIGTIVAISDGRNLSMNLFKYREKLKHTTTFRTPEEVNPLQISLTANSYIQDRPLISPVSSQV